MKVVYLACIGLLVLAILATGCTSQPAQTPATPAPTSAPVTTVIQTPAVPSEIGGTTWSLAWYDDTKGVWSKVVEGSTVTATFLNEGKITGSGGCNGYSADFHLGNAPQIWIRRPEVPQNNLCQSPTGVMKQESAYFTDLEWAETYSITNGQLVIFNRENRKILQFDPVK